MAHDGFVHVNVGGTAFATLKGVAGGGGHFTGHFELELDFIVKNSKFL